MYELVQVAENTYYINSPSKIGVYRVSDDDVWLIDSGNDKDAGRKIQKILDAQGWKLTAIINTHSNADHDGGNTLLQNRLNCAVYSTPMENIIVENPILEPTFLYGGYPFKKLLSGRWSSFRFLHLGAWHRNNDIIYEGPQDFNAYFRQNAKLCIRPEVRLFFCAEHTKFTPTF